MADGDAHAEVVLTGQPKVMLLACTRCGCLLWDIERHYADLHPDLHPDSPPPGGSQS